MTAVFQVKLNDKEVQKALKNLPKQVTNRAMNATLNKAIVTVRARSSKSISNTMDVKVSAVKKAMIMVRSSLRTLAARIFVSQKRSTVPRFQQKGRKYQTDSGVRVKGKVYKNTFIATMKSGYKSIWKRRGFNRLPIREIFAGTIDGEFNKPFNQRLMQAVSNVRVRGLWPKQMKFYLDRFFKKKGL